MPRPDNRPGKARAKLRQGAGLHAFDQRHEDIVEHLDLAGAEAVGIGQEEIGHLSKHRDAAFGGAAADGGLELGKKDCGLGNRHALLQIEDQASAQLLLAKGLRTPLFQ